MAKFSRQPKTRPDDILDSALNQFLERGFTDVTMAQIALTAGITAGTIYRYFDSKDALVAALVARHGDTSWARGAEVADAYRTLTARAVVALLLHRWADQLEHDRAADVLVLVTREAPRFPTQIQQYSLQLLQIGCTALQRALRHGIERGEFSATLEIEGTAQALAATLLEQMVWRSTFAQYLPPLPPGVDPGRLAIDALARGIPRSSQVAAPRPDPPVPPAALGVENHGGLRITTLKPPEKPAS
jgi:AcrR family transcriptional regulator